MRVRFLTYLLAVTLIAGSLLLVGCGGGEQQNGQSEGSKGDKTTQKASGKEKTNKPHTFKGTVTSVLPDKDNLTVKRKNGAAKTFKYKPDKDKVKLDGKEAGPDAIEKGQYVRLEYLQYPKVNIAHSIKLRSEKSGASGGETTG